MEEVYKLRGKFTERWLKNSEDYYLPIALRIHNAQWSYLKKKNFQIDLEATYNQLKELSEEEENKLLSKFTPEERAWLTYSLGITDFYHLLESIHSLNRSFAILLEAAEPLSAMALIRLQLDNLTYLIAELNYPFQILYKVFFKGRRLNQIEINGQKLNPSEIRKESCIQDPDYNLCTLYNKYSGFVHPDPIQMDYSKYDLCYRKDGKHKIPKRILKDLTKDMIIINRIITRLLQCQIFAYNTGIIDNKTYKY